MPFEPLQEETAPVGTGFAPIQERPQYNYIEPDDGATSETIQFPDGTTANAPVGTGQIFSALEQDDAFDDVGPSSAFEEAGATFEKQAAFIAFVANAYGLASDEATADIVSSRSRALANAQARSPERVKEFNQKFDDAKGFFETTGVIISHPDVIGRQIITNTANSALPLVTTLAGAGGGAAAGSAVPVVGTVAGGVAGSVGGAFVGGAVIEIGAQIDELLSEEGYDATDPNSLLEALQNDDLVKEIRLKAERKGLTTAAVDALFQVVGGRFLKLAKVKGAGKAGTAAAGTADVAVQSFGEGVGEFAGQVARDGKGSIKEAVLEGVTGLGQSVGQTAIGASAQGVKVSTPKVSVAIKDTVSKARQKIEALPVFEKVNAPEQIVTTQDADLLDAEIRAAERDLISAVAENQIIELENQQQADIIQEAEGLKSQISETPEFDINSPSSLRSIIGHTPQSLSQFIKREGGIVDRNGELAARDITTSSGVGIIRRQRGGDVAQQSLDGSVASIPDNENIDFIREKVFDAGFFPDKNDFNDISDSELFDAIASDINGERVYNGEDLAAIADATQGTDGLEQAFFERGIDRNSTVDDIAGIIREEQGLGKFTPRDVVALPEIPSEVQASIEGQRADIEAVKAENSGLLSGGLLSKGREGIKEALLQLDKAGGILSTRIKNISPELFSRLRKFEFDLSGQIISDLGRADQFLVTLQGLKKQNEDAYIAFDLALKNRNGEQAASIAAGLGIQDQYNNYLDFRAEIHQRALDVGLDIGHLQDYFPRHVHDVKGLMDYFQGQEYWNEIQAAVEAKEVKLGRKLTDPERAVVANTLALGRTVENISLERSGHLKERTVEEITVETNKFYSSSEKSLSDYIYSMNNAIETAKLFGKNTKIGGEFINVEDSIGAFLDNQVRSESISSRDLSILKDILNSRFNGGRMGDWVGTFRDLTYLDVLGSPFNTITQFADIAPSIFQNGLLNTLSTIPSAVFDKTKIDLNDINIQDIAQEFDQNELTNKAINKVFQLTGFNKIDRIGKLTLVNSALKKAQKGAKQGDKELLDYLTTLFADETGAVLNDLKNGVASDNVKFYLANRLLDVQPLNKLEVPEYYNAAGNWKILYLLKSFTIKQINLYRQEGFGKVHNGIKNNNPKQVIEGMRNFAYLYGLYVASGASADWMKDFVRGLLSGEDYEDEPEDYVLDNMFKAFGFSRYQANMISKDSASGVFFDFFLPPTKFIDNVQKDFKTANRDGLTLENSRSIRSIPVGGELYYFWFGGGSDGPKGRSKKKERSF